jgi:anti-anti-sigma factor
VLLLRGDLVPEQHFRLRGDVDMARAAELRDDLEPIVRRCPEDVVIDCTELTFLDSSGIAVLVEARDHLDRQGRRFRMENVPRIARRTIEVLGLVDHLGIDRGDGTSATAPPS